MKCNLPRDNMCCHYGYKLFLFTQGVLRQVPLVGSLLNWWSPPPKDAIKGRAFNLSSGSLSQNTPDIIIRTEQTINT